MTDDALKWWRQPRTVSIVIDNNEWMLAFCNQLAQLISRDGDNAVLCRNYQEVGSGGVAFFLSCHSLAPVDILERNHRNLVVHASNLPQGRGWSPLSWQIINGINRIPVCLLEAHEKVDSGPVVYRDEILFEGHELIDEIRQALGMKTIEMCCRYLSESAPLRGQPQVGEPSYWSRRNPEDSRLDPDKTLAEQFNLLRIADNNRYPVYFEWLGYTYLLRVEKSLKRIYEDKDD
jgi:methionyl-tRNA formyltransferase